MPAAIKSEKQIIDEIFEVFRDRGVHGATITQIAHRTGLGKSTLYYHFPNGKADMIFAMFYRLDEWTTNRLLDIDLYGVPQDDKPAARLDGILREFDAKFGAGRIGCVLASLAIGDLGLQFRPLIKSAFKSWIGVFYDAATRIGFSRTDALARAEDAVIRLEGALILSAGYGNNKPFQRTIARIVEEFANVPPPLAISAASRRARSS